LLRDDQYRVKAILARGVWVHVESVPGSTGKNCESRDETETRRRTPVIFSKNLLPHLIVPKRSTLTPKRSICSTMCALNFLLYLVGHLLHWVGLGEDSNSQKLKRDFEDLKQKRQQQRDGTVTVTDTEDVLSAAKHRNKAGELIRDALEVLMREQPSAFQEARRSGSGPFIEILKVSADAGFRGENKKLLFENNVTTAGNKFNVGADGCLLKKCSGACGHVISVEEFAGVSAECLVIVSMLDQFRSHVVDCIALFLSRSSLPG